MKENSIGKIVAERHTGLVNRVEDLHQALTHQFPEQLPAEATLQGYVEPSLRKRRQSAAKLAEVMLQILRNNLHGNETPLAQNTDYIQTKLNEALNHYGLFVGRVDQPEKNERVRQQAECVFKGRQKDASWRTRCRQVVEAARAGEPMPEFDDAIDPSLSHTEQLILTETYERERTRYSDE